MKRFAALIGIFCVLAGLKLADNGLLGSGYSGKLTVYAADGAETVYEEAELPLLHRFGTCYTRLDLKGNEEDIKKIIKNLGGRSLWTERLDGLTITYAYSPTILFYETVGNKRVNIMLALSDGGALSVGSPLLLGSY